MRHAAWVLAIALSPVSLYAAPVVAPAAIVLLAAGEAPLSVDFSVNAKTTIPGKSLSAGHYKISIIEHLSDRVILQVSDANGKVEATFLGLITRTLPAGSTGPISWSGKGTPSLRGFAFPGAPPVEFVYPKLQAVEIAKSNPEKVLAVDPASDNLAVTHDRLSTQDMQIVTLWTLKSSRIGPDAQPAIEAARYRVEAPSDVAPPTPSSVASAAPPAPLRTAKAPAAPHVKPVPAASSEAPEPVVRKHTIAVLPHTGSTLPEWLLAAVLALLGSTALRLRRVYGR